MTVSLARSRSDVCSYREAVMRPMKSPANKAAATVVMVVNLSVSYRVTMRFFFFRLLFSISCFECASRRSRESSLARADAYVKLRLTQNHRTAHGLPRELSRSACSDWNKSWAASISSLKMDRLSTLMPSGTPDPALSCRTVTSSSFSNLTLSATGVPDSRILFSTSSGTNIPSHLMNVIVFARPHGANVRITFLGTCPFFLQRSP